ncbi:MAG: homocysteine S-methyltransferase family protein [Balneolaceae bacterium]|nr:homocysteine S-methyltransferase family protein [Balneolaceae bacterium]
MKFEQLKDLLEDRILILDGAMGTMIQGYNLGENDFRADRFSDFDYDLQGNNDLLSITQPGIIKEIHAQFLESGSDIIETNTFSANAISQADYHLENIAYEMDKVAAQNAREVADRFTEKTPDKPRFVARCGWTYQQNAFPITGCRRSRLPRYHL